MNYAEICIIKRDGKREDFSISKIKNAISKAFSASGIQDEQQLVADITMNVISQFATPTITVEEIQDLVEKSLMKVRPEVAKKYIIYREWRNTERDKKTQMKQVMDGIVAIDKNDVNLSNANMSSHTPAGQMMTFASEVTKDYTYKYLLPKRFAEAHQLGDIHIHDLDYYPTKTTTCIQYDMDDLFERGFRTKNGSIRTPQSIQSYATLATIIFQTNQNEQHGGQAIPAFDFYLAPYVRNSFIEEVKVLEEITGEDYKHLYHFPIKDYVRIELDGLSGDERVLQHAINRTVSRVHQSMEAFIHNMNTIHSRGGNQVVFSSVNYGTDTSAEGRCIIREMLTSTYRGVGSGGTAIFPIQIWKKKRGVNYLPQDPNYDLYVFACKVSARRFFPNFINLDATFNRHELWKADDPERFRYETATMGCRTRVFENRFGEKTSIGRGNLSFSTINIVRLAIECMDISEREERIRTFFSKLDELLELTALQLHRRFEFQKTARAKQFPLLMSSLWLGAEKLKPEDTIESVINQGTLGIGFIGLAECLVALTGKHHAEDPAAQQLGIRIITRFRDKANEFSERWQHNYSVLATPAEGLSGRFTQKDKKSFGIIPGVTDREYYTNSNHVPVYYRCSARHKAEIEAPYHDLTRGGHIFYVEIDGDATHNPDAIMSVVDMMDRYNMGYCSVNHNRNRCMDCGHEDATDGLEACPNCGGHHIDRLQRITGYLVGTTNRWNQAKLAELNDRVRHN